MEVILFTAALDDRYGQGIIRSRIGLSEDATVFDEYTRFNDVVDAQLQISTKAEPPEKRIACVLVDEAQFLTAEQVDQLAQVVDERNLPVLCFGIRTDFQGELFAGSSRLLAIADKLSELKTVCSCGRKATMTIRLDDKGRAIAAGNQVEIGGNERYESKCRRHHRELMQNALVAS